MPKATAITAPGRIANKREALSSATQLAAFGVRTAKFTHRFSADGGADFSSNYILPAAAQIISVGAYVSTAYTGAASADIKVGSDTVGSLADISATGLEIDSTPAQHTAAGEITIDFDAPATAGEMTVAVSYIDLSEIK